MLERTSRVSFSHPIKEKIRINIHTVMSDFLVEFHSPNNQQ